MVWGRKDSKLSGRQAKKLLKQAQDHEKRLHYAQAVELYRQCEAHQEAARVLALDGRHAEAGQLLHATLGLTVTPVASLTNEQRKLALLAATYLDKGGDTALAVEILTSLGELDRAARLLERSGDLVGAQRLRYGETKGRSSVPPAPRRGSDSPGHSETSLSTAGAYRLEQQGKLDAALEC
jgi:tetratricopeptide (TPR) repeat protein